MASQPVSDNAPSRDPGRPAPIWIATYALLLAGATLLAYAAVLDAFFVCDDFSYLHHTRAAETVWERLGIGIGWTFFRPLTALSFWPNMALGGLEPLVYHLTNLGLHLGSSLLLAATALRMGCGPVGAAICGGAFALSPVQVEAVSWISGRGELVFGFGAALCLWGWFGFTHGRGRRPLLATILGLSLALLGKDSAMVLPPLLSATVLFAAPRPRPARLRALIWVWAVLLAYLPLRMLALGGMGLGTGGAAPSVGAALGLCGDAVAALLAPGAQGNLPYISLGLVAYALLRSQEPGRLRRPALLLGCCAGIALLPPAALGMRLHPLGEGTRVLYLPAMFFALGLGHLFDRARPRGDSRSLQVVGLVLLVVYALGTRAANQPWARAGATSSAILSQLQELRRGKPYEWLAIYGLPDRDQGAQVLRNGLPHALGLFVDPPLSVGKQLEGVIRSAASWEELAARRRRDPELRPEWLLVRWDAAERRLVTP